MAVNFSHRKALLHKPHLEKSFADGVDWSDGVGDCHAVYQGTT
ncbi:hypothetical protein OYT1_ch2677 [Ferriphaselus amnicola]|uniref:Uncharacterized protein n=1 Tax=Ferriphaselus amnicola TaxID=1188319 RepID=A0A2Z6GFZ2_9PROT|nr:hypothetical protein OYT1_ch2677 [Ferriphaselus amnicola]